LAEGNPGDVKPVGEGVSELRIDYGPGYGVYFKARGRTVVILLAGGDKRTQSQDVKIALRLARELSE
jgi:putative addiction module killer protein